MLLHMWLMNGFGKRFGKRSGFENNIEQFAFLSYPLLPFISTNNESNTVSIHTISFFLWVDLNLAEVQDLAVILSTRTECPTSTTLQLIIRLLFDPLIPWQQTNRIAGVWWLLTLCYMVVVFLVNGLGMMYGMMYNTDTCHINWIYSVFLLQYWHQQVYKNEW